MRAPRGKVARFLAYAVAGLALVAVALVLALPLLVDVPRVHAELERQLSALVRGTIAWDALHVQLLPAPRGVLEGLRLEVPQVLDVRAARLETRLRFWPLLRGRVEVVSLTAFDAKVRLGLAPTPVAAPAAKPAPDPVALYRAAAGAASRALQAIAPDTQLAIEQGAMEMRIAGLPALQLQALSLQAQSDGARAEARLTASGANWRRLQLDGSLEYATLAGRARLDVEELDPRPLLEALLQPTGWQVAAGPLALHATLDAGGAEAIAGRVEAGTRGILLRHGERELDLPALAVKAEVRSDAARAEIRVGELLVEGRKLLEGTADYAYASRDASARAAFEVDAARVLDVLRRAMAKGAGLEELDSASGRLRGSAYAARREGRWRAGVQISESDASVRLRRLPWPARLREGSAEWQPGVVGVSGLHAELGRSAIAQFGARLRLQKEVRLESASGKAKLDLGEIYPWLREQPALAKSLQDVDAVAGELDAELRSASGRLAALDFALRVQPRGVRIQAKALPGVVSVDGGAARLTRTTAQVEQVGVSLLDSKATLAGSATGLGEPDFRLQARIAEGGAGPQLVDWALAQAKAPAQLALHAPFAFDAEQLDWGPGRRLNARAQVRFDQDTSVEAEIGWEPDLLDLKRLAVKDAQGRSESALQMRGRQLEGRFSGTMHGAVLAYFLKDPERFSGRIEGDLRFKADLDHLRHASADGRLGGESVDLAWLAGRPLKVDRFSLDARQDLLKMDEVVVSFGKDSAVLRGELRRSARGPVVDATIESEGVNLDQLIAKPAADVPAEQRVQSPASPKKDSSARRNRESDLQKWWPLPVTGRVGLRAGYVQSGHYRVAPLALAMVLEEERAHLEVAQAQLCGIALPFTLEARPDAWLATARLAATRQPVEEMMRCLTGEHVKITGNADLAIELKTQGRVQELLANLQGSGRVEARDGRIQKFALIGNIMSLLNIEGAARAAKDLAEGVPEFGYRRIAAKGHLREGLFTLEEGVFEGPSAGMAANGTIRLTDGDTNMTVLVAPWGRVDRVVRGIPIVGYVIGGTLTSIPVGVSGDIRHPIVVPLGPRAVTKELLGVFQRTLKLPSQLAEPPSR